MAIGLASKQIVTFEELVMPLMVSHDALIRLLIGKGTFTKLDRVREVDQESKKETL